jgi:hypothetical protein
VRESSLASCFPSSLSASAQVSAAIDIDATHTTPLNSNFSGFNDEVVFPAEYFAYRFNNSRHSRALRRGVEAEIQRERVDGDPLVIGVLRLDVMGCGRGDTARAG